MSQRKFGRICFTCKNCPCSVDEAREGRCKKYGNIITAYSKCMMWEENENFCKDCRNCQGEYYKDDDGIMHAPYCYMQEQDFTLYKPETTKACAFFIKKGE